MQKTQAMSDDAKDENSEELLKIGRLVHGAILAAQRRDCGVDRCMRSYSDNRRITSVEALLMWGTIGQSVIDEGVPETGVKCDPGKPEFLFGRNLYAAIWAAKHGYRGIDNVIRKDLPKQIDTAWDDCARNIVRQMFSMSKLGLALRQMPNGTIQ